MELTVTGDQGNSAWRDLLVEAPSPAVLSRLLQDARDANEMVPQLNGYIQSIKSNANNANFGSTWVQKLQQFYNQVRVHQCLRSTPTLYRGVVMYLNQKSTGSADAPNDFVPVPTFGAPSRGGKRNMLSPQKSQRSH